MEECLCSSWHGPTEQMLAEPCLRLLPLKHQVGWPAIVVCSGLWVFLGAWISGWWLGSLNPCESCLVSALSPQPAELLPAEAPPSQWQAVTGGVNNSVWAPLRDSSETSLSAVLETFLHRWPGGLQREPAYTPIGASLLAVSPCTFPPPCQRPLRSTSA